MGSSGIAIYEISVPTDGSAFAIWLTGTVATSATYFGVIGHRYALYFVGDR